MSHPNFVILYVSNPTESAAFYSRILGSKPVQASPTFVLFALESGVMLGLWGKQGVDPAASVPGGGGELAFALGSDAEVDARYAKWRELGISILLTPKRLDFGYTFAATDADGHRLRVFAPAR